MSAEEIVSKKMRKWSMKKKKEVVIGKNNKTVIKTCS